MRSIPLGSHPYHKSKTSSSCPTPCRVPAIRPGFQRWLSFILTQAEAAGSGVILNSFLSHAGSYAESATVCHCLTRNRQALQKFTVLDSKTFLTDAQEASTSIHPFQY